MVKADMSRDYYGDLQLAPTANENEVKKQFRKLALIYHPDRNTGNEDSVTAKFQMIQSAHEVLTDPTERARYDQSRVTARRGYHGASGVRGNPWQNPAPQYAPPPRPPGFAQRTSNRPPPPPSAGAARYSKFSAPKTSANATSEGAEGRKKTYEAWESMRPNKKEELPPRPTSWKPSTPARDYTKPSARDESNNQDWGVPPKTHAEFKKWKDNYSPDRGSNPETPHRRGFTPATPGGDEPAAPKGAYFTNHKSQQAPEPPPRGPPAASMNNLQPEPQIQRVQPDPLQSFRKRAPHTTDEPRASTPYATHGGEKLNPFDSTNVNRSKSTRGSAERAGGQVPRTGSDPNLGQSSRSNARPKAAPRYSSSSDDEPVETPQRRFAQPRRTHTEQRQPDPEATNNMDHSRKPTSGVSEFRRWLRENPGQELNSAYSDAPPPGYGNTRAQQQPPSQPNTTSAVPLGSETSGNAPPQQSPAREPNMYSTPQFPLPSSAFNTLNPTMNIPLEEFNKSEASKRRIPDYTTIQPRARTQTLSSESRSPHLRSLRRASTVPSTQSAALKKSPSFPLDPNKYPTLFPGESGATTPPYVSAGRLNPFEFGQNQLLHEIVVNKRRASGARVGEAGEALTGARHSQSDQHRSSYREPADLETPPKKNRTPFTRSPAHNLNAHIVSQQSYANVNIPVPSFSFPIDDNTFDNTEAQTNGFKSPSTESINTKFTPEDWDGKFAAGSSYFNPEQSAAGLPTRGRAQSGSRSRGRSPAKGPAKIRTVEPQLMQPHVEEETPIESPGGTRFSADDWKQTFKPQTFMPPPPAMPPRSRKGRQSSLRTTMGGNAAFVDDSENTSDEKPLFTGRKPASIVGSPSPDAMEVDTPPVRRSRPETPSANGKKETLSHPSPGKRAAVSPASQSPTDEALKVDFDDLKLRDLISTLDMPSFPTVPVSPVTVNSAVFEVYRYEFKTYMAEWELFNTQFIMHMLARKKENDTLGASRYESTEGLEAYRSGLKADQAVLDHWRKAQEYHAGVLKQWAVQNERTKGGERPRKKVY